MADPPSSTTESKHVALESGGVAVVESRNTAGRLRCLTLSHNSCTVMISLGLESLACLETSAVV